MKGFFIFIVGFLLGIFFGFISGEVAVNTTLEAGNTGMFDGLKMFEERGKCISKNNLVVFQALNNGFALATEENNHTKTMLVFGGEDKDYYDGEIIIIPKNKCFRQIGVFKYESALKLENIDKMVKTVPVVKID